MLTATDARAGKVPQPPIRCRETSGLELHRSFSCLGQDAASCDVSDEVILLKGDSIGCCHL